MKRSTGAVWKNKKGERLRCEICGKFRRKGTAWCHECITKGHSNITS